MLDFGGLSRSEVGGWTVFSMVRLADETAVPFCKKKENPKFLSPH